MRSAAVPKALDGHNRWECLTSSSPSAAKACDERQDILYNINLICDPDPSTTNATDFYSEVGAADFAPERGLLLSVCLLLLR